MELFLKAEKEYQEKRLQSAYRYYRQCLQGQKVDEKTILVCCRKIVELSDSLGIGRESALEEALARSFFHLARYGRAAEHGEAVDVERKNLGVYEILWESYFRSGNLLKADKAAADYLVYCKNKHLCDRGLNFIKKLEEWGVAGKQCAVIGMELEILRGNTQAITQWWEESGHSCGEGFSGKMHREMGRYWDHVGLYKKHWEREEVVRKMFLKHWRENLNAGRVWAADTVERKKIMYLVLVDFLLGGSEFRETLEVYARIFEREELAASLEEYKNKKCSLPNDETSHTGEGFDGEPILERDFPEGGMGNVLGKIRSCDFFSGKHADKVDIFLDGLSDDFLIKNAENLLVCMIEMELYDSALKFINRMRNMVKKESVDYQINMAYMEVVALERAGKHYQAMDHVHDVLTLLPVKREERDTFLKKKELLVKKINLSKESV